MKKKASSSLSKRRCGCSLQSDPIGTSYGLHFVLVGTKCGPQRPPESRSSTPHATVITLEMIVSLALPLQPTLSANEPTVLSWNVSLIGSCDWTDSALNVQFDEPAKKALKSAPAATLPALERTHGTASGVEGVPVGLCVGVAVGEGVVGARVGVSVALVGLGVGVPVVGALLGAGVVVEAAQHNTHA